MKFFSLKSPIESEIVENFSAYPEEERVIKKLLIYASKFKKITDKNEKIRLLIRLNEFIKKNKELIKKKCPDLLVDILNSF